MQSHGVRIIGMQREKSQFAAAERGVGDCDRGACGGASSRRRARFGAFRFLATDQTPQRRRRRPFPFEPARQPAPVDQIERKRQIDGRGDRLTIEHEDRSGVLRRFGHRHFDGPMATPEPPAWRTTGAEHSQSRRRGENAHDRVEKLTILPRVKSIRRLRHDRSVSTALSRQSQAKRALECVFGGWAGGAGAAQKGFRNGLPKSRRRRAGETIRETLGSRGEARVVFGAPPIVGGRPILRRGGALENS